MIRIFSKIRNKYIAEGHLTRYFWYALGEILLVMVGILLALQVNDWNEDRLALVETKDYLAKKLVNLDEDLEQLQRLHDYRIKIGTMCTNFLEQGYENSSDYEIVSLTLTVTVERRFVSAVSQDQRNTIASYYKNIAGTEIEKLELYYEDVVNFITFTESRLNTFSESLEEDLWRDGFFNDNRELFIAVEQLEEKYNESGEVPALKRDADYSIQTLLGITRRNEILSGRLAKNYTDLMKLNNDLQAAIKSFINNS